VKWLLGKLIDIAEIIGISIIQAVGWTIGIWIVLWYLKKRGDNE